MSSYQDYLEYILSQPVTCYVDRAGTYYVASGDLVIYGQPYKRCLWQGYTKWYPSPAWKEIPLSIVFAAVSHSESITQQIRLFIGQPG